jgi:hypothetical protein
MRHAYAFVPLLLLFSIRTAAAQDQPPPQLPPPEPTTPPPTEPPPPVVQPKPTEERQREEGEDGAPPPATGFQMAIRTGLAIPFGSVGADAADATSKVAMSDVFSPQVPIIVDLGGKPIPNLFVGAYIGIGFGGAAGKQADACSKANAGCVAASFRIGVEVQYHIAPEAKLNPWVGYGIGLEGNAVSGKGSDGNQVTQSLGGVEYAHISGGFDFRLNKGFGIGPMADFSMGQYSHLKVESGGTSVDGDIQNTTLHEWLTIGLRMVVFP